MIDQARIAQIPRFDLLPNYRFGQVNDEMERADDGVWVRWEDIAYLLSLVEATPPMKEWRCFHCHEVFTDEAEAREHFGRDQEKTPACRLSAEDVSELRALEARNAQLERENEELENDSRLWHGSEADRVRRIGHTAWWQELDSKQGEILALQEQLRQAQATPPTKDAHNERVDAAARRVAGWVEQQTIGRVRVDYDAGWRVGALQAVEEMRAALRAAASPETPTKGRDDAR